MKYTEYLKKSLLGKITLIMWLIILVLEAISIIMAKTFLPPKFFLIGIVVAVVLAMITWLMHFKTPKLSVIVSLLLIVCLGFGTVSVSKLNNVTNQITKDAQKEVETVSIACLKDSKITAEDAFDEYKLAYMAKDDTAYQRSSELLNDYDKAVKKSKPCKSAMSAYVSLTEGRSELIYLTPMMLAKLDEHEVDVDNEFKILLSKEYPLEDIQTKTVDVKNETYTIYIQGVDASSGNDTDKMNEGKIFATGRGDCNILLTINPVTNQACMQVIPRDLKVYIPNKDVESKLSYSAWWGGVQASIDSLEQYFDIDINYYAKLNFAGLTTVIDELGGVNVWSDYDFAVDISNVNYDEGGQIKEFNQGYNYVNGEEGLAFARARKMLPDNAQSRSINHLNLVKGIFRKFAQEPTYNHALDILDSISTNFVTNVPKKNFKDVFNTTAELIPDIVNDRIESNSMEGEIEFATDPVRGMYKRYFIPADGEREAVKERIDQVINSSKKADK
ncbi:MAG: LCP family protein [Lachnospiraceae bacterium]|nr:LCP family protein [Lachnospiraceae bacterium]